MAEKPAYTASYPGFIYWWLDNGLQDRFAELGAAYDSFVAAERAGKADQWMKENARG